MDRQDPCHAAGPLRTSLSSERSIKKIWELPCRISLTFNAINFFKYGAIAACGKKYDLSGGGEEHEKEVL
jgi:hypothetical protein